MWRKHLLKHYFDLRIIFHQHINIFDSKQIYTYSDSKGYYAFNFLKYDFIVKTLK